MATASAERAARRAAYADRTRKRIETCRACPHFVAPRIGPAMCGVCDCLVSIKTRLPGEKCPQGRW